MTSRAAWMLMFAACAASATTRTVVTTQVEFHEAEPAAQPARGVPTPTPDAPVTPTDSAATGTDALANSSGPMVFGMLEGEAALEDAWDRWNAGKTTTYDQVFEIAVLANRARPLPMSDELMVIALARAVEMSGCDPERLGRIRLLAIAVNGSPHTKELDEELARLADTGPVECTQRAK
jgi:hypothetical protein